MTMKMFARSVALFICVLMSLAAQADDFINKPSPHSVATTLDRLEAALKAKDIAIFARVDHAAGATKAGEQLADSQLLIFGNPKLGTPLMQEQMLLGLDLPMKALAWQDSKGQVWLSYLKPSVLQQRYGLKNAAVIEKMTSALDGLSSKATGKD